MTYNAKVISGGKIVLPAELRRELDIKEGDSLVIERDSDGGLLIKTYAQVVREVQAAFKAMLPADHEGKVVDEFLAERRAEAARENAEFNQWSQRDTAI